jgi:uncharacterized protein CbrC (UPF0167 family)
MVTFLTCPVPFILTQHFVLQMSEREGQRTKCIHCEQNKFYVWTGKPPYNYTELQCCACGKHQGLNPE